MNINSDINILGNLPDYNFIKYFLDNNSGIDSFSGLSEIKTTKSIKRFEKAVKASFLHCFNESIKHLMDSVYKNESISKDYQFMLFWNMSINNDLFHYLNNYVYFPSFYSGRVSIKTIEVKSCIIDLKSNNAELKTWKPNTVVEISSAYLRVLKKLNLLEGTLHKTILHPFLSDKMFVLFIYWIKAIETNSNLLESEWLKYSFCEKPVFIERLMQKKFSKYFQLLYTGDKLKVETLIPYSTIYHAIK